jgi:putative transposon-encoded protein
VEKSFILSKKPKRRINVPNEKNLNPNDDKEPTVDAPNNVDALSNKVKFEIYGEEMIEKRVKSSGNSGRVYLPPNWVGHKVKIIRI